MKETVISAGKNYIATNILKCPRANYGNAIERMVLERGL